jgi:hypothetical protein
MMGLLNTATLDLSRWSCIWRAMERKHIHTYHVRKGKIQGKGIPSFTLEVGSQLCWLPSNLAWRLLHDAQGWTWSCDGLIASQQDGRTVMGTWCFKHGHDPRDRLGKAL